MATVTVVPEVFSFVLFDSARIVELVGRLAEQVGLPPDKEVRVEIDERSPLGRTKVTALDPITLAVEGGAFEDAKRLRHLSDRSVIDVTGRLLFRAADRLDPAFGDPPPDAELSLGEYVAWDCYAVARIGRLGYPIQQQARRRYHFRIRHGFTDTSDAVFDRIWRAERLTWADLAAASAEALAATGREPQRVSL